MVPGSGVVFEQEPLLREQCAQHDELTLMIRNVPHNLTRQTFLAEIDGSGFKGLYNFFHMPCHFKSQATKGYAFINLISLAAAGAFKNWWHKADRIGLNTFNPSLNISPAAVQGFHANVQKWNTPRLRRIRDSNLRPFIVRPISLNDSLEASWECDGTTVDLLPDADLLDTSLQNHGACVECPACQGESSSSQPSLMASTSAAGSESGASPCQGESSSSQPSLLAPSAAGSESGEFDNLMSAAVQAFLRGEEEAMCIDSEDEILSDNVCTGSGEAALASATMTDLEPEPAMVMLAAALPAGLVHHGAVGSQSARSYGIRC